MLRPVRYLLQIVAHYQTTCADGVGFVVKRKQRVRMTRCEYIDEG